MVTRLRYVGDVPTAFSEARIGMLENGDEFGVPNAEAEAYTRRADIEVVSVEPDETDEPESAAPEEPEESPAEPVAALVPTSDPEIPAETLPAAPEPAEADPAPAAPVTE